MKKGVNVLIGLVAVAITAAVALHYHGSARAKSADTFSSAYVREVANPVSFSEVENAKATLEAFAKEYVLNVKALQARSQTERTGIPLSIQRTKTLRLLLQGYGDFRGTSAEPVVVRSILDFLSVSGEHATWLELYMDYLYRHPTDSLVGELKEQAVIAAARCTGESDLNKAFEFVSLIPGNLRNGVNPTFVSFGAPKYSEIQERKWKRANEDLL